MRRTTAKMGGLCEEREKANNNGKTNKSSHRAE